MSAFSQRSVLCMGLPFMVIINAFSIFRKTFSPGSGVGQPPPGNSTLKSKQTADEPERARDPSGR
jgi:hypothetical protein